jgi:hypothetical protein
LTKRTSSGSSFHRASSIISSEQKVEIGSTPARLTSYPVRSHCEAKGGSKSCAQTNASFGRKGRTSVAGSDVRAATLRLQSQIIVTIAQPSREDHNHLETKPSARRLASAHRLFLARMVRIVNRVLRQHLKLKWSADKREACCSGRRLANVLKQGIHATWKALIRASSVFSLINRGSSCIGKYSVEGWVYIGDGVASSGSARIWNQNAVCDWHAEPLHLLYIYFTRRRGVHCDAQHEATNAGGKSCTATVVFVHLPGYPGGGGRSFRLGGSANRVAPAP